MFTNFEQNQSLQPGAGESQNPIPAPFYGQGSQPPRVGAGRRNRVQQNRYAVPSTMHYSESSQAEAGQQIDRLNHLNLPLNLVNENPEPASNPSNSQNIGMNINEMNNDQTSASDSPDDIFQQLANGQQDSAQPGVPATFHLPSVHDAPHPELLVENNSDSNYQEERDHDMEEEKEAPKNNRKKFDNKNNQERKGAEEDIRSNHQEEISADNNAYQNDETPYKNAVIRKNEQYSPREKEQTGLDTKKIFTPKMRRQSNPNNTNSYEKTEEKMKKQTQPF